MEDGPSSKQNWTLQELERFINISKDKMRDGLTKLRDGLAKESDETKEMLEIYYRYTAGKATEEELAAANEQFRDLIRAMGLGIFLFLPGAPITIPFFVKVGKMVGVDVLPSAFRKEGELPETSETTDESSPEKKVHEPIDDLE